MARENLSNASLNALLAQSTGESFLVLLDITDGAGGHHQFTSDAVNTIVGTEDFSPGPTTWDDSDARWVSHNNNTFTYSRGGTAPSAFMDSPDVGGLVNGVSYDVVLTINNTVGTSILRPYLGNGFNASADIDVADGVHTVPIVYDDSLLAVTFEVGAGANAASFSMALNSIHATGQPPPAVYEPFPFDIRLPANIDGKTSVGQLVIDNVSRNLIDEIRSYTTAMDVVITIVRGNDPTDIVATLPDLKWRSVQYDAQKISGELSNEDFLAEQLGSLMTGQNCPGLFFS